MRDIAIVVLLIDATILVTVFAVMIITTTLRRDR